MPRSAADETDETAVRAGYWAAFGYQNHVIPVDDPRREGSELIAFCGVMTDPEDISPRDARPTCCICSAEVRSGRVEVRAVISD
ncbi:hypothetical protein MOQ72_43310 [Saccharopolyspora sp. K220]|uniref:hypothetical protein n=1 Tax=Saccharopolyspora soli TaxID=2926618 RepID=UPI001F5A9ED9|nr:hypothetical protein [Saccharopolyspora soli]MCI2424243.1 hypothetical protein [Saccharopolyspora soli]